MISKAFSARRRAGSRLLCCAALWAATSAQALQIDIPGPTGSTSFGDAVRVLPNGNIVVVDTGGPVAGIGAVHLYDPSGALISTLTGGSANDRVGSGGVVVLPSGNFLVRSPDWDNTATSASDAGAVTWVNGNLGLSGVVSPANSLVGSSPDDSDLQRIVLLSNGNYLVVNRSWDRGALTDAGAVTWGDGNVGVSGTISLSNSLVGSAAMDMIGRRVTSLNNGNYVVCSPDWDNGAVVDVGAATWGNGASGLIGAVALSNSLVGVQALDQVCSNGAIALSNGHYAVLSPDWNNGAATAAGAVTWGNGQSGTVAMVSTSNSFFGRGDGENTGAAAVALSNGNYVVTSPNWDNGAIVDAGAATLLSGNGPVATSVSSAISLVGSSAGDRVGQSAQGPGVVALANGNYVVVSERWDSAVNDDVGAVTWGSGVSGVVGTISAANSLVGTSTGDRVGFAGVYALTNGHYVVASSLWDSGAVVDAGAATWGNGSGGSIGPVSIVNSLIGSSASDLVGSSGVVALSNGNYVVRSPRWNNGATTAAGAVTWGNGTTGITGIVGSGNSLVGSSVDDQLGALSAFALPNGNFVMSNAFWDNGSSSNAGAVTWVDGSTGLSGSLSAANSMIGTAVDDLISSGLVVFADANYATFSNNWDNGGTVDAGAVTLGLGDQPLIGSVMASNSVIGARVGSSSIDYDPIRRRLAVGRPADNLLSLLTLDQPDPLFANGFE